MLDPLTIERLEAISGASKVVVGLSGGGDSIALLSLLCDRFGADRLCALVVDHGLREGSADDAQRAKRMAEALGVKAETRAIAWPMSAKPGQAAARRARYDILLSRARQLGARVVALGHTADDQIETVFMRAAAQSSWRGLAGMAALAPAPAWPEGRGLYVARPLLNARRVELRAYLGAARLDWIEDPANANTAFARVRARQRLAALEAEGAEITRLASCAKRLRPHVAKLDAEAWALIARSVQFEADLVRIDGVAWQGPALVRRRALSALIASVGAGAREAASNAIERLEERLFKPGFAGACLAGARLALAQNAICISRDPGALLGRADGAPGLSPLPLAPGQESVWDRRLELTLTEPGWEVVANAGPPELRRGRQRRALEALGSLGQGRWLLSQRVAHLLGRID